MSQMDNWIWLYLILNWSYGQDKDHDIRLIILTYTMACISQEDKESISDNFIVFGGIRAKDGSRQEI